MFWVFKRKPKFTVEEKLSHVVIDECEGCGWYVASRLETEAFPHCGYLRSDGTWGISIVMESKRRGYFDTKQQAEEALQKWLT